MILGTTPNLKEHRIIRRHGAGRDQALRNQALPMEFTLKAQQLVAISLEGSVG
ncbi:MAG: hypothetical protein ABI459_08885 [Deltaproteobacteria bacterium]